MPQSILAEGAIALSVTLSGGALFASGTGRPDGTGRADGVTCCAWQCARPTSPSKAVCDFANLSLCARDGTLPNTYLPSHTTTMTKAGSARGCSEAVLHTSMPDARPKAALERERERERSRQRKLWGEGQSKGWVTSARPGRRENFCSKNLFL